MTRYRITPVPAPRLNRGSRWNPQKSAALERYHAYRDHLRALGVQIPERARIIFALPLPKARQGRAPGHPHRQRPDLDNLIKGLLDAVFRDDAHVHEIQASKVWADEGSIYVAELD